MKIELKKIIQLKYMGEIFVSRIDQVVGMSYWDLKIKQRNKMT